LPLTSLGREKKKVRRYLLHDGAPVYFRYEGKPFEVTIENVLFFPQGYAAVLDHSELLDGEPSVILADVGGWTVDVMRLDNGLPDASACRSLELGMIRCLDEIGEQIRRSLGLSMTAAQIETVLREEPCGVDGRAKEIIQTEGRRYTQRLLSAIAESGLDARAMPVIFMGGGASVVKRHVSPQDGLCRAIYLEDVCANAKGYERLAGQLSRGDGNAG
jgi:plasmid segregation protein ParM